MFGCQSEVSAENFKKINESKGDYEDTAAQNSHSDKEKKIPEFVGETQSMTNKDPRK